MFRTYRVSKTADIGKNVRIGDYCIIGEHTIIKSGTELKNNVIIGNNTTIGNDNVFFPFSTIGMVSQDRKYAGEPTYLEIGDANVFREYVSVHRSSNTNGTTRIGNNNLFLAFSHAGHDAVVENNVIVSGYAALAGYASIMEYARLNAHSSVMPFCRIGKYAYIAAHSKIINDIIPYVTAEGSPAKLRGLNIWTLKKHKKNTIPLLKEIYDVLTDSGMLMKEKIEIIKEKEAGENLNITSFIIDSKHGVCTEVLYTSILFHLFSPRSCG
ncbi:MAG: acyl-ACP--UDP-N-acetylglucosamine O-acyltransferase [Spirochaetaceae bacterium]|jgi:UDP-N-acetylglucosamine acyltransferase|nr:acyl-ACP--UDP-N-acetylglucosamine O-acyltransferase [Spirochaetaceae bacterium]